MKASQDGPQAAETFLDVFLSVTPVCFRKDRMTMGKGTGGGGGGLSNTDLISVVLSVKTAKTLLSALTAKVVPDTVTAKAVALALSRALSGGSSKKGKGGTKVA
jgi:hypothetical protein